MASKKPERVFRIGKVSGSIFANDVENESGKRTIRSVSIQKRYKDGDEVKYAASFGLAELPQAVAVLQMAQQYIAAQEAEVLLD